MRDDDRVRCEVAREALSARLDGERQHVPAGRVDAHLESCRDCRAWLIAAAEHARRLGSLDVGCGPDLAEQIMAVIGVEPVARHRRWRRWAVTHAARCALIAVGVVQCAIAGAQMAGFDFGMVSDSGQGPMTGEHLMHESTAWSLGIGLGMIAAGIRAVLAPGVAVVLGVFTGALVGYVVADAEAGQVTAARIASHAPVLLGLVFALLVVRKRVGSRGSPVTDTGSEDIVLPPGASRGRRRRHLWPVHRSVA